MSTLGSFIRSIADQLRGPYRPNQYGNVILRRAFRASRRLRVAAPWFGVLRCVVHLFARSGGRNGTHRLGVMSP